MKHKRHFFKKNFVEEDSMTQYIEKARDMAYWFPERF